MKQDDEGMTNMVTKVMTEMVVVGLCGKGPWDL